MSNLGVVFHIWCKRLDFFWSVRGLTSKMPTYPTCQLAPLSPKAHQQQQHLQLRRIPSPKSMRKRKILECYANLKVDCAKFYPIRHLRGTGVLVELRASSSVPSGVNYILLGYNTLASNNSRDLNRSCVSGSHVSWSGGVHGVWCNWRRLKIHRGIVGPLAVGVLPWSQFHQKMSVREK
jgi:hypothetical protein